MGIVADQMKDMKLVDGSSKTAAVETVPMWIGPKNKKEVDACIDGHPTIIPCAVGDNIQDGTGVLYYQRTKRFMTMKEMHEWQKAQRPEEARFPCPHCVNEDGSFNFVGNSATALINHIADKHPADNIKKTPDYDAAKARRLGESLKPEVEEGNVAHQTEEEGLAPIVVVEEDTQCQFIKADHTQCGNQAKAGSDYCGIKSHQGEDV